MVQDILVYSIVFGALGRMVYSIVLFFKRSKNKESVICPGCSQCGKEKITLMGK
jgi:hypothetical protein